MTRKSADPPTVFVVDDDVQLREALALLMDSVGLNVETFDSAQAFLQAFDPDRPGCLVLDIRMPGMSGLELQRQLVEQGSRIPMLILTAHAEVPMAVEALKAGAMDFFEKPYRPHILLDRVQQAIAHDARDRREHAELADICGRFESLSDREREVLHLLVRGENSKKIATKMDITATTVDFHRRNLMEKIGVETLIGLGRLFETYQQLRDRK